MILSADFINIGVKKGFFVQLDAKFQLSASSIVTKKSIFIPPSKY